jgi:HAD superfamily hydrolase (TIGR01509 family)
MEKKMTDEPRGVLWDLDGTLVDTAQQHFAAWVEVCGPRGVTLSPETFLGTFGRRNMDVLRDLLGQDLTDDEVLQIGTAKETSFRRQVQTGELAPLTGVAAWLTRLRAAGWRQAIASSAPHANIEAVLDRLDLHAAFDAIVGEEDVQRGKPDPQVFLVAASRLGVSPERVIVVEDAPVGIAAARAAGMRSIGVAGSHPAEYLAADLVVNSLALLSPDAFEQLLVRPRSRTNCIDGR